jgi:hypothetical protein
VLISDLLAYMFHRLLPFGNVPRAADDEEMTLHLPDGTHHTVRLTQDDDDAFRVTPDVQRLIDAASGRLTAAAHSRKAIAR